mgnify:CR=1 FL=1
MEETYVISFKKWTASCGEKSYIILLKSIDYIYNGLKKFLEGNLMANYKYSFRIKDRQTGKVTTVYVEAANAKEAKSKAIATYGVAYEVL